MRRLLSVLMITALMLTVFNTIPKFMSTVSATDDYDTAREAYRSYLIGGSYNPEDPDIEAQLTAMASEAQALWTAMNKSGGRTYLWSDFPDGSDAHDVIDTYDNLKIMTIAYCSTGCSLYGNTTLKNDIISALDWLYSNWYNENLTFDNYWASWQMGIPRDINDIVVLLYSELTSNQISNYMDATYHFNPEVGFGGTAITDPLSGANLVWDCKVFVLRGIIVKNGTEIESGRDAMCPVFDYITETIPDELDGGFFTEGSFIQHDNHPYTTGGYGDSLLGNIADILCLLSDTQWDFTDPDVNNLYNWIYDTFEPAIYKGTPMAMLGGRNYCTDNFVHDGGSSSLIETIALISTFAPAADAQEYKEMVKYHVQSDTCCNYYTGSIGSIVIIKQIMNDANIGTRSLVTNKVFYNMDRVVHFRTGFAFGLSLYSNWIANYESINDENLKGWYTGEGMTYLYNDDLQQYGDAYWATVNKYRLPGTTVDTRSLSDQYAHDQLSTKSWAGGVSLENTYGVAGMDLQGKGSTLTAKKSWFMFDDEIVALGAGINSTDNRSIETIVDSRKIDGSNALTVNGTSKSTSLGWSETMTGVHWIHLAGNVAGSDVGYYFPTTSTINGLRKSRTDSWSSVNEGDDDTSLTRNYLTLWYNHGSNPTNASYEYVMLPNKTSSQVYDYAGNPNITVWENNTSAQAVKENLLNIVGVNFWTNSTITVGDITCNKKASVMTKENTDQDYIVCVSDPTHENTGTIDITINKSAKAVISSDDNIAVTQLSPTIKFSVNVNSATGSKRKNLYS